MSKTMTLKNNRDTKKALASLEKILPARIQLNAHPDLHELFKKVSFNRDEVMSDLITDWVIEYLRNNGQEISETTAQMYRSKPKDWTR